MTNKKLRIIFMGTPDFSVPALEALHDAGHTIVAVYTQPPRPKGRGYEVTPSPVYVLAAEHHLPVHHPKSLKNLEEQKIFAMHNADVAIVAAYGLILPKAVLDAPKYGCINIHASLLPRWRGASPIQRSIWAGDAETGVTLMQMDEGLDTGPMIASRAVKIHPHTTATSLHDELSALGKVMIVEAVKQLAQNGKLDSEIQQDAETTYAPLLTKEDGKVNWTQNAAAIDRQIRALNPWPGVWTMFQGKRIKILEAALQATPAQSDKPGLILDREGHITCGENSALKLLQIKPEGKNKMDFTAALNGGYIKPGEVFS